METRANYLLIGLFTLAGIAGLLGLTLWFAQVELDRRYDYYDVKFDTVSGLSAASEVRFAGLPVGQVVHVQLSPDLEGSVHVRLEVDATTPVRTDSIATIEAQGITGVAYVGISAGDKNSELLTPSEDGDVPEIPSGQSMLQSLTQNGPALITETLAVVEEVREIFGEDNQRRVENILQNAEDASEALAGTMEAFASVPQTVEGFVTQVEAFNGILAELAPEVEELLKTADTAVESLGSLAQQSEKTMVTADGTLTVVQGTFTDAQRYITEDLAQTTVALQTAIEEMRGELSLISEEARTMLGTFNSTGVVARERLVEAQQTLDLVNKAMEEVAAASGDVSNTVEDFDAFMDDYATPLVSDTRVAIAKATEAIDAIRIVAQDELPLIVADIRTATATASQTIEQVAADLTAASGRVEGLSETAETALAQVAETFENANVTLDAITAAMETGDRTLAVAQETFEGANKIINEDIDGIISGLEQSLDSLNSAIGEVSEDIPAITDELRNASSAASEAFASLNKIVEGAGPSVADFASSGLPLYTRLADETRALIRNLDRLTVQIQRDPARFFLNQQTPEFQR